MLAAAEWGWTVEGLGGSGHGGVETAELHLSEPLCVAFIRWDWRCLIDVFSVGAGVNL